MNITWEKKKDYGFYLVLIIVGGLILAGRYGYIDLQFGRDWPWLLVIAGSSGLFKALFRPKHKVSLGGFAGKYTGPTKKEVLKDLENGKMTAEEAAKKIRGMEG